MSTEEERKKREEGDPFRFLSEEEKKEVLFWVGLLYPILYNELGGKGISHFLKSLSEQEFPYPGGKQKKPSVRTLWRKVKAFREEGIWGFRRKVRSDKGKSHSHRMEVIKRAVRLKKEQQCRSAVVINQMLEHEFGVTIPRSTLYRHLKQQNATKKLLGGEQAKVRCRWTREHTHDLWLGDFEHGPLVIHEGKVVGTRLSVFIDCYSRYPVEARYYLEENFDVLVDSFLRALAAHGAPLQIYVDGAKIYNSKAFLCALAALGIRHRKRPAGDPPPGGLVEKFIQTIQSQFEAEVKAGDPMTLRELNEALAAYLRAGYMETVHSETGETPKERYQKGLRVIRQVDLNSILPLFMKQEKRRVHRDFSDIQLNGRFYLVSEKLRGLNVLVRYDPYGSGERVFIYSLRGEYLGEGVLHGRRHSGQVTPAPPSPKPTSSYIEVLISKYRAILRQEAGSIDYRKVASRRTLPFSDFVNTLARLMGRKGGMSSFSEKELALLKEEHSRLKGISKAILREIVAEAQDTTFLGVLSSLQRFSNQKED